jgi:hypothetical protein
MLTVNLIKINKILINAKVGYSNVGGLTFGIGIVQSDCTGMLCFRCPGPRCYTPPTPEPVKGTKGK